jgi:predicted RNA-binding protein
MYTLYIDVREIMCENKNWIEVAQDRVQWWDFCEHNNEPFGFIKAADFLTS